MKNPTDAYASLTRSLGKIFDLTSTSSLLSWDEQVNLPSAPECAQLRGRQLSTLAEAIHEAGTSPSIKEDLEALESQKDALTFDQKAVIREARRDYDLKAKLPPSFVAEKTKASSQAYHAWAEAREASDFSKLAPHLERNLELAKQESAYQWLEGNPYDYWVDQFDPGVKTETIERLFSELKEALVPLLETVLKSDNKATADIFKGFPVDKQRSFLIDVTTKIGFDYNSGRIDVALHPFCSGSTSDCRLTTRFNEDTPLDSLYSSIHEAGHGLYEQGLPLETEGTPLSEAVGSAIHESQSRLWENQVGRSRAFWKHWEPLYRKAFALQLEGIDSEIFYRAINAVERNPIRVDSDELTYNLHIILRFTLEKRLFAGELSVKDLPEAWNALTQELLGFTPKSDKEGVLQDVHWPCGFFGYFPSYCLGNMTAAQWWELVQKDIPNLEEQIAQGEYATLLSWLRKNIHEQGKRYRTLDLIEHVTGKPLSAKPLIAYLQERYLPLYS